MRPMTDMDDEMLAGRAAAGEREAFRVLLERHYDRVFRVAYGVVRHETEAQDVAQDVWAAIPRRLRSWRGDARFTTWLHSVTLNAARDSLRRGAARAHASAGFAEIDDLSRGEAAEDAARLHWLRVALEALSDDLRETAALVLGDDMTHAQAAEILEIAEGTVAWRMSEVRRRLKTMASEEALI